MFITKKKHEIIVKNLEETAQKDHEWLVQCNGRVGTKLENLKDSMYDLACEFQSKGMDEAASMLRGKLIEMQMNSYNKIL